MQLLFSETNTETNARAIDSKESEELNAERSSEMRKRKRIVTLNPTVTWEMVLYRR